MSIRKAMNVLLVVAIVSILGLAYSALALARPQGFEQFELLGVLVSVGFLFSSAVGLKVLANRLGRIELMPPWLQRRRRLYRFELVLTSLIAVAASPFAFMRLVPFGWVILVASLALPITVVLTTGRSYRQSYLELNP